MEYAPNQRPTTLLLTRDRVITLLRALNDVKGKLIHTQPASLRIARAFALALPRSLPYEVRIHAEEWALLSTALRYNPNDRKARALYELLRPHCRFLTVHALLVEERKARTRRLRRLRGEFDRDHDPSAPRVPRRRG